MTELSGGAADLGMESPTHLGIVSVATRPARALPRIVGVMPALALTGEQHTTPVATTGMSG